MAPTALARPPVYKTTKTMDAICKPPGRLLLMTHHMIKFQGFPKRQ